MFEAHRPASSTMRLACGDTAAGHQRMVTRFELPAMTAWVHSTPAGPGDAGGDVHYVSVCDRCLVSRIALADVSGHGHAVSALATTLRVLMQRHLTTLAQTGLMRDLNDAVRTTLDQVHYATMVAMGWHGRRRLLVVTNAGHPPPLLYRAARRQWTWLDTARRPVAARPAGVPLGLLDHVEYDRRVIRLEPGDVVVLYSDGVSEATGTSGEELGRDGLLALATDADGACVDTFGTRLIDALSRFRGDAELTDDHTLIVLVAG